MSNGVGEELSGGDGEFPLSPASLNSSDEVDAFKRVKIVGSADMGGEEGEDRYEHITADEMDEKRKQQMAYEYLCHLEEAKTWIEACIGEELPPTTELEENWRNGVFLAKLGHFVDAGAVPLKSIFDQDQKRYERQGLQYRHTDNVVRFFRALEKAGLPQIFYPDTADVYDRKNMPKLVYCIHALSMFLFKKGLAPQIQDLYGKVEFTEEEISTMRQELEKYGIQMPQFHKIGGILATEMPVDEAALHAAVIAINEAIQKQNAEETLGTLGNPAAHLVHIDGASAEEYQTTLYSAKDVKAENARNRSLDPDYEADAYDEMLTQAEIQGHVTTVNVSTALGRINEALLAKDSERLGQAVVCPYLGLTAVDIKNKKAYMDRMLEMRNQKMASEGEDAALTKDDVQAQVLLGNQDADVEYQRTQSLKKLNKALAANSAEEFMAALQSHAYSYPQVYPFAAPLYFEEFRNIRDEKGGDLDYEEVCGGIRVLGAIACINKAVDSGNVTKVLEALQDPTAHMMAVDESCGQRYLNALSEAKERKEETSLPLLKHVEIQESIDAVNRMVEEELNKIGAVTMINEALASDDPSITMAALLVPEAQLEGLAQTEKVHYHNLLKALRKEKAEQPSADSEDLWWEEIQETINRANREATEGQKMSIGVATLNLAADAENVEELMTTVTNPDIYLANVKTTCGEAYMQRLAADKAAKGAEGATGSGWMRNEIKSGHPFFFNMQSLEYAWELPAGTELDSSVLTRQEIQTAVTEVTDEDNRQQYLNANEGSVVRIQSAVRGFQARKKYQDRMEYIKEQEPAVVKIQSWYKAQKQRQQFMDRLRYLRENEAAAVKLQSYSRMFTARKKYKGRLTFFKSQEGSIVKLQAAWRSNMARHDYKQLMHSDHPPLSVVRKFVHLLDQNDVDYAEEMEVQALRQQVVTSIRSNKTLESDLDAMDIKIGLLVKNRITITEVISHEKKLKKYKQGARESLTGAKGLTGLSKESRQRLESYQQLFYRLQTHPEYLAKLIFEMPESKSNEFMESVILTLYNYASNLREEFLLLKLFATSLQLEIRTKLSAMSDLVQGNPLAIKMVVRFNRNARGQSYLRDMLNPLVQSLLQDEVKINTNPVEVYKTWVSQMETETGETSKLPYEASYAEALEHEEVRKRIEVSVEALRSWSDRFLNHILKSLDTIPYGMRYISRTLLLSLKAKFPASPEKDILKIVGNLLYYRYINSAIVAPDTFDIVDVTAERGLTTDQRRNLGSVAKILQFAASNKGFGGDSQHLASLNPYIKTSHERFKEYFLKACDVPEPEVFFNMDQYTEATMVTKPMITISVSELLETHKRVLEYENAIAEDYSDPLHNILIDLGKEVPTLSDILGEPDGGDEESKQQQLNNLASAELSLTLANRFEVQEDEKTDLKNLLIRTKRMAVDVIRVQTGENLLAVLERPSTEAENEEHKRMIAVKEQIDQRAQDKDVNIARSKSLQSDQRLALEEKKRAIRESLKILGEVGLLSSEGGCQAMLNLIAQDIRNQRRYRQTRKQDLVKLRTAIENLSKKRKFYSDQIDYYNQYVKACMENLVMTKQGAKGAKSAKKSKKTQTLKSTGQKLHEQGVLLDIEGIEKGKWKNLSLEISATDSPGLFYADAKLLGVSMDRYELKFQDLLQLQYEGVAVMTMFEKAKINVNLLVFLLNKKFYGKG